MRYIITHTHKKKTGGKLSANQILTFRATKTKTKISFEAIRVSCWPCLLRLIKTSVHRNHSYNPNGFYFYYYFFFALFFVLSKKKRNGLGKVKAYGKQSRKFNSRLRSLLRRGTDVVSADQRTGWTAVEDESLVDFSLSLCFHRVGIVSVDAICSPLDGFQFHHLSIVLTLAHAIGG